VKVPILNFPWNCWKCRKEMKVTYPISQAVYESQYRGNLAPTYSKTQQANVIGNLCPYCGAYQGNLFVWDECIIGNAYDLEDYVVGFLEIKVNCRVCGKKLEDVNGGDIFSIVTAFDESSPFQPVDARRITDHSPWLCNACFEKKSAEMEEINHQENLRTIREGPLIQCKVCKRNTRENPETVFELHHLSYFPEEKIAICSSCHMKIHHSNSYLELKPKDRRISTAERKDLETNARIQKIKEEGKNPYDEYCIVCRQKFKPHDSSTYYHGTKIHTKCLPER
jgi:hypothetical protein